MSDVQRHLRNIQAEIDYNEKVKLDKEIYEIAIEGEDGLTITSTDYTKRAYTVDALESSPKGVYKKAYKGRKPGER